LFFLFDIETTGLSIYEDHITEIAAKVVGVPTSSVSQPTFSSLVRTTQMISNQIITICYSYTDKAYIPNHVVSDKTGITTALLSRENPLSVVLPNFLKWVYITTP